MQFGSIFVGMTVQLVSKKANRLAVGCFFFIAGLSFASWASRIPDIKTELGLNDAALGAVLFALPLGSIVSLPLSGWLVTRFSSKKIATIALCCYPLILVLIGLATASWQLAGILFSFGLFGNMCNISVNTQAVGVEALYGRSIMASFHGIWSLAGFTGAAIGTLMVTLVVSPFWHFCMICGASLLLIALIQGYALQKDAGHPDQPVFVKPDLDMLKLGLIAFSSMVCEGTMFDWSGVYFQNVVAVPQKMIPLGYAAFMSTMAAGRFLGDRIVSRFGKQKVLQLSGIVITTGLLLSVVFPTIIIATTGFLLVGFGVSSVIPLVYSSAGKSTKFSPGVALAIVSSIGFLGFLLGPPLIGFIAQASSLRWSFTLIAILGFGMTVLSSVMRWEK
jgi:MFS family permease